jgi:hypothetical protein
MALSLFAKKRTITGSPYLHMMENWTMWQLLDDFPQFLVSTGKNVATMAFEQLWLP